MSDSRALVLGTAQLGMDYGIANKTGMPDFNKAYELIKTAIENGIHTFDTAQAYGKSQTVLGRILSKLPPGKKTGKTIKIISKADPAIDHLSRDVMEEALLNSLNQLGITSLYGYMLHGDQFLSMWDNGIKDILLPFKKKGWIKHIGISVYNPGTALLALEKDGIDILQIPSNIFDQRFEHAGIFNTAKEKQKIIYIRSVFLQGLLLMDSADIPSHMNYCKPVLSRFETLSTKMNLTKPELAMGYARQNFPDAKIVIGVETTDQLKENIKFWDTKLSTNQLKNIKPHFNKVDKRILDPSKWDKLNVLAILQARMSSSRLPGKVLKKILGKPMLQHQLERLFKSQAIEKLVVATSTGKEDDPIEILCLKMGIDCFRGDLEDVLDRFYKAAKPYTPENVVRLTGDCPLCDPEKIDELIEFFMAEPCDYASNCEIPQLPDGLDAEIFTLNALKEAWENATLSSEREHVTLYIKNNKDRYRVKSFLYDQDLSHMRWTVDEPEDFTFVNKIYKALYPHKPNFKTHDILDLLEAHPHLNQINTQFIRNDGLIKSLRNDILVK